MNRVISIVFFILSLTACSLNADQERNLSQATNDFLEAKKKGVTLAIVSMYHPKVVRAYKDKGDSIFIEKFNYSPLDHFYADAVIKQIKKSGSRIHVDYEVKVDKGAKEIPPFIAISEDSGKSWFFIDRSDYVNKSLLNDFERLIIFSE